MLLLLKLTSLVDYVKSVCGFCFNCCSQKSLELQSWKAYISIALVLINFILININTLLTLNTQLALHFVILVIIIKQNCFFL